MNSRKKWAYLLFVGGLTSSALWACYWQSTKYFRATNKWKAISEQLQRDQAAQLAQVGHSVQAAPFLFVGGTGTLSTSYKLINRAKGERLGYFVLRVLQFPDLVGRSSEVVALDGWIPEQAKKGDALTTSPNQSTFRGLLRSGESKDYLTSSFGKETLEKQGITSFIGLKSLVEELGMQPTDLNTHYFVELFKDPQANRVYPSRATKQDFQRPYLTPAKHRDYATFWAGASLVGLAAMLKVLRMR